MICIYCDGKGYDDESFRTNEIGADFHKNLVECIINLRSRIERLESIVEHHNLTNHSYDSAPDSW